MKTVATIREHDELDGDIIHVGYELAEYDGETGYRVVADNGDDVGYYRPQSAGKCIADIFAMWGQWDTFEAIEED